MRLGHRQLLLRLIDAHRFNCGHHRRAVHRHSTAESASRTSDSLGDGLMRRKSNAAISMPGIAKDNNLHPLQQAFREHHGLQRGFCNTILYNGEAARSCIMFAVQADGAEIVTVEGKATPPIFAASRTFSIVCGGRRPREDAARTWL
jgi:hypothetical protein